MDWDLVNLQGTSRSKKEQVLNFSDVTKSRKYIFFYQCCGSGSGIRCLFDPWVRDPE
jgi:hypothetical protein